MIPRFLVPHGAKPPAIDAPTTRRRPTALDERTLVPAMLPIVPLDGHSNIPSSLPLDSIAARVVVPRDIKREDFAAEVKSDLPLQPTEMDERMIVPQGSAAPELTEHHEIIPTDLIDPDVFMTGEVNLLTEPPKEGKIKWDVVTRVSSIAFHILLVLAIIFEPKIFPPHAPSQEQLDIARRQITVLLPPGAFETPKATPRPKEPPVHVDSRILREVAPPQPQPMPTPPSREPEHVRELPSAPVPQPNSTPPQPTAKVEMPKEPPKLETPQEQKPTSHGLILPNTSPGKLIQNSVDAATKMNAPTAVQGGGKLPNNSGIPGSKQGGSAFGNMEMLTPTQGVDFDNYLHRVYLTVKQNWEAVMPESVRLGDQGIVSLQFRIMKNGVVPIGEPERVRASGKEPLDRAAISSIRASTPFEPLPSAFSGDYIELRFTYYYNLLPDNAH